jgi:hypothetical protein
MNVVSVSALTTTAPSSNTKDESIDQDYAALIAQFYPTQEYKTRDEINAEDSALSQFKDDLTTKGATLFLKDLNEEKIEAIVEEYRQKLLKEQSENPDKPMDINQMVSDFRKQLLKEMIEAQKAEQQNKSTQNTALMSSDILENIQNVKNDDKKSAQNTIGFLEQMLNTNMDTTKKRETLSL